ncbi:MAG: ankyrin repeat domain-containing protein [Terriglobales bacterium]
MSYVGYDRVHWKGKRHARISVDAVQQLVEHVRAGGFFDLPGSYDNGPCLSIDSSEGSLRVRLDGREKSVGTCGAPPIVDQLMAEVDSAAHVWRWVVIDPDELRRKIARGWHVSEDMPKIMEDAIDWNAVEIIRILVRDGADANGLNSDKEHFLMGAVRTDHVEAARALLEVGADWKSEGVYDENPATEAGFRSPEMVKLFIEKGADLNAVSGAGHTMLMNAVYLANLSNIKLLVDAGADVNVHNKRGESALSIAEGRKKEYWNAARETALTFQPIIDYLVVHGAVR